jgi:hypothetical protein
MMDDIWKEVDAFLAEHEERYKMSFGLEFSHVVDWVADFTPRRGHPQAREYGLWQGTATTRDEAIRRALTVARDALR